MPTRLAASFVCLAMVAGCATAEPDPATQAAKLMAQAKGAAGGALLDRVSTYYSSGTRVRDGKINGVYQEWGDYRTMAFTNVETFAGVTSTGGFDGKTGWRLGPDGKAQTISNPQQLAGTKLSGYLDVQGYFFPDRFPAQFTYAGAREADGRRYDVVVVTPAGGNPLDLWLEPRTHLLKRLTGKLGPASRQARSSLSGKAATARMPSAVALSR
jgi:hypothetical protein